MIGEPAEQEVYPRAQAEAPNISRAELLEAAKDRAKFGSARRDPSARKPWGKALQQVKAWPEGPYKNTCGGILEKEGRKLCVGPAFRFRVQ